jgi:nucleoside-diphosphate-sugar epimerase
MTSSIDAIARGYDRTDTRVRTESDWSNPERSAPYAKSKFYAERAAWEFVSSEARQLELVAINPGLVLGPLLHAERPTSLEVVRLLMAGALPAVPRISFAVADVHDVVRAHRLAMETSHAAGKRYIVAGEQMWMGEIAALLHAQFAARGYRIPTRAMPYWLLWTTARFDRTVRLALDFVGVPINVSSARAQRELGWTTRPAAESIQAAADSLLRFGVVPARGAGKGRHASRAVPAKS